MSLDILQWNPINDEYGQIKASIYIKPTLSLLEFANRNVSNGNRTLMVQINGTEHSVYDGSTVFAILDKTSDVPECRQNFFNATGLYVMTLKLNWNGYPNKNGTVTIYEGIVTEPSATSKSTETNVSDVPKEPKSIVEKYESKNDSESHSNVSNDLSHKEHKGKECMSGFSNQTLFIIGFVFLVIIAIISFAVGRLKSR